MVCGGATGSSSNRCARRGSLWPSRWRAGMREESKTPSASTYRRSRKRQRRPHPLRLPRRNRVAESRKVGRTNGYSGDRSLSSMKAHPIGIVGAGSVAQSLGRLLYSQGEPVVAVVSRTPSNVERAARFIGPSVRALDWVDFARTAARVLIATSDSAISQVAETLASAGLRAVVVLHTCGAKGPEVLEPLG